MTVELHTDAAPPLVFLLAWLAPLGAVGPSRTEAEATTFPFRQVSIPNIEPDTNLFYDSVLGSVHTFCRADTPTRRADAFTEARRTDQRLMLMQHDLAAVTLPDAMVVRPENFRVTEKSALRDYKVDTIYRFVARVEFDLSIVAV